MHDDEIRSTVVRHLATLLQIPPTEIGLDNELNGELGLDSLGLAELRTMIEVEYQIVIDDDEIDQMVTASNIAALVAAKRASSVGNE